MSTEQQDLQDSAALPNNNELPSGDTRPSRVDPAQDDLEKRLAWLTKEIRAAGAEAARKKRSQSVLEAREYKTAAVPGAAPTPRDLDLPKVTLGPGLKPADDPSTVERNGSDGAWHVDVSEPAEVSRTLPLDPRIPIVDPFPFRAPRRAESAGPSNWFVLAISVLGGILMGTFWPYMVPESWARRDHVRTAFGGARIAALRADERYEDWLTVRALAAQWEHTKNTPKAIEEVPESAPYAATPASRYFPYMTTPTNNSLGIHRKVGHAPLAPRVSHE